MRCVHGDGDGPVRLEAGRERQSGMVAASLEATPVVVCEHGHTDPAPIATEIVAATESALPRARRRALRGERCTTCGATLTMPGRRTQRSVTVDDLAEVGVLTVTFDVPSVRCTDCGTDQLPSAAVDDLDATVRALFTPS